MMKVVGVIAGVVTVLLLLFSVTLFDDINRAALIDYTGQKSSGSFAGIAIGDPQSSARETLLQRGMTIVHYQDDGSCPIEGQFDDILVFVDLSWRKGNVCIGISQGAVKSIAWRYNFLQP
jgi:hypothetical protein